MKTPASLSKRWWTRVTLSMSYVYIGERPCALGFGADGEAWMGCIGGAVNERYSERTVNVQ